jgi:hypothetical protein
VPSPEPTVPTTTRAASARELQRHAITEHFLTALENVVWRYRALQPDIARAEAAPEILAEALTGEVAHHLAWARASLYRWPSVQRGRPHPDRRKEQA